MNISVVLACIDKNRESMKDFTFHPSSVSLDDWYISTNPRDQHQLQQSEDIDIYSMISLTCPFNDLLNHLPLDKMAAISQTVVSCAFSAIIQHWFRKWLGAEWATSHHMDQCWPDSYHTILMSFTIHECTIRFIFCCCHFLYVSYLFMSCCMITVLPSIMG